MKAIIRGGRPAGPHGSLTSDVPTARLRLKGSARVKLKSPAKLKSRKPRVPSGSRA
jgi:hypothetical protein